MPPSYDPFLLAHWKATSLNNNGVVINIVNEPDEQEELPELLERLGLNSKFSIMNMGLKLRGERGQTLNSEYFYSLFKV